jgi:hypothetical protein
VKGQFAKSESLMPKVRREEEEARLLGSQPGKGRRGPKQTSSRANRSTATGRRPVLAAFIQGPMTLVARYKRKTYRARVRRDGSVLLAGHAYNSPSTAGSAVVNRSCNGWTFWSYERSPGDWVALEELRRR